MSAASIGFTEQNLTTDRQFIGGRWEDAAGDPLDLINPASGEIVGHAQMATEDNADKAQAIDDTFRSWGRSTASYRWARTSTAAHWTKSMTWSGAPSLREPVWRPAARD